MANLTARKIHKNMYPGINFKGDDVGSFPSGWTNNDGVDCETTIIASFDGHRKVMQLNDQGAGRCQAKIDFTQGLNSEFEFWVTKSSIAANKVVRLYIREGSTYLIYLIWEDDDLDYDDGVAHSIKDDFLVANTLSHFRLVLNDTANTFDCYIDGVLEGSGLGYKSNSTSGANNFIIETDDGDTGYKGYLDALGISIDANYNIGDNIHYRHFKESTDSLELDDVGTQGTSITWVDAVDTAASFEIVQEFNEHKKVLRGYYSSGVGGWDIAIHDFSSQTKTGWFACFLKVSDATIENRISLQETGAIKINFRIDGDKFQIYTAGAWRDVTNAPVPTDNTWYHIYIQWYDDATDTFDLWIDNIQYEDGTNCVANQVNGINQCLISSYSATEYMYIDAPISSLDSDVRADNRTFDYHIHSYDDITANISLCKVTDVAYQPSTAIINSDPTLSIDINHIIRLYDINGDLRFEGDFIREVKPSNLSEYPLISINDEELLKENSYSASGAEDINATLLGVLTNVDQTDGRLIYYTEDDPAGNLTPNYKNKPIRRIIKDLAIHGAKYGIIQPNGIVCLDADRNPINGAETISESTGEIMGNVLIDIIDFQYRYITIRGGIDPSTGTPFSGEDEDTTISGIKRFYKRFRELQSGTDCTARAAAFRTAGFTPTIVNVSLKSVYGLPGEIINFAYSPKSLSATDFYVEEVTHNLINGISRYRLNSGILDRGSMNEPGYTLADETSDDIAEILYETDINTISLALWSIAGTRGVTGWALSNGHGIYANFYTSNKVDPTKEMIFTLVWMTVGDLTIDGELTMEKFPCDGNTISTTIENHINHDITTTALSRYIETTYTLSASDLDNDSLYRIHWDNVDANPIVISAIQVQYYIKRVV